MTTQALSTLKALVRGPAAAPSPASRPRAPGPATRAHAPLSALKAVVGGPWAHEIERQRQEASALGEVLRDLNTPVDFDPEITPPKDEAWADAVHRAGELLVRADRAALNQKPAEGRQALNAVREIIDELKSMAAQLAGPATRAHGNAPLSAPGSTSFDPTRFGAPRGVETLALRRPEVGPNEVLIPRGWAPDDFAWQVVQSFQKIHERDSGNVIGTILPAAHGEIVITIQRYPRAFSRRRGLEPLVDVGRVRIMIGRGPVVAEEHVTLEVDHETPPNIRDAVLRGVSALLYERRNTSIPPRPRPRDLFPLAQLLLDELVRDAQRSEYGMANVGRVVEHVRNIGNKGTDDVHAALRELEAANAIQLWPHEMMPGRFLDRQLSPPDGEGRPLVSARPLLPYRAESGDPIIGYRVVLTMRVDHPERRYETLPKVETGHTYDFVEFTTTNRAQAESRFDQLAAGRVTDGTSPDGGSEYATEIAVSAVTQFHNWAGWIRGPERRERPPEEARR